MVSLPEPPIAFSITAPAAMATLPTSPPTLENPPCRRSMVWAWVYPEKSNVSVPPASQTAKIRLVVAEVAMNQSRSALELKP